MSTPTLPDDRIEAMRSRVMSTVFNDIRQRGRRTRQRLGAVAASVIVVGIGAYGIGTWATSPVSHDSASQSSVAADSGGEAARLDTGYASGTNELQQAPSDASPQTERQVITTGSISVTVDRPRQSAGKLSAYVESLGGRVDSRTENGRGDNASASMQVRVPADQVTTMIERLKTYGSVDDVSLQNEDVTSVSQDLDARIDALEISVDRLQAILAAAGTSKEVIAAERALTERQEQLESLQSQKRSLVGQVELSTLSVDFTQSAKADSVEPGGFTGGLRDGWNGLVATVNAVVEVAGVLLPWALVIAALAAIAKIWRSSSSSRSGRSRRSVGPQRGDDAGDQDATVSSGEEHPQGD